MNAPVQYHAAACLFGITPVARDPPAAVNTGGNAEDASKGLVCKDLFHDAEIFIPAAVLMDGKHDAVFFGSGDHFLQIRGP